MKFWGKIIKLATVTKPYWRRPFTKCIQVALEIEVSVFSICGCLDHMGKNSIKSDDENKKGLSITPTYRGDNQNGEIYV